MQNGTFDFQEFCKQVGAGAKPSDFEFTWSTEVMWFNATNTAWAGYMLRPDVEFRKLQKMIVCNGWSIPAPMENTPSHGSDYFIPRPAFGNLFEYRSFYDHPYDKQAFHRGLMHGSRENAARHACAMMNVNPDGWESFQ